MKLKLTFFIGQGSFCTEAKYSSVPFRNLRLGFCNDAMTGPITFYEYGFFGICIPLFYREDE
jgi:hypothetical protein